MYALRKLMMFLIIITKLVHSQPTEAPSEPSTTEPTFTTWTSLTSNITDDKVAPHNVASFNQFLTNVFLQALIDESEHKKRVQRYREVIEE